MLGCKLWIHDNLIKWLKTAKVLYWEKVIAQFWTADPSLKAMQPSKACFWRSKSSWLERMWPVGQDGSCPLFSALELVSGKERRTCVEGAGYMVAIYPEGQMIKTGVSCHPQEPTDWFLVGAWANHSGTLAYLATMEVSAAKLNWFSKVHRDAGMECIDTGAVLSPCFLS